MKRVVTSIIAFFIILLIIAPGGYILFSLIDEDLDSPSDLCVIETKNHKYYVRKSGVFNEQGLEISELTERLFSIRHHNNYEAPLTKVDSEDIDGERQILNKVFEDMGLGGSPSSLPPRTIIVTSTQAITISKWKDSDDLTNDDEIEIEIPVHNLVITQ